MDSSISENIAVPPSSFRSFLVYMDFAYVLIMALQKSNSGNFPSKRFESYRSVILLHLISGSMLIYHGSWLQYSNEKMPITVEDDTNLARRLGYYIMALNGVVHSITVFQMSPKVMGEKRITIPAYISTGVINFCNAINLLRRPNLANAFLLWGGINVFIMVRVNIFILFLANIDWELNYTYSVVSAGGLVWSMTNQTKLVNLGYVCILFYAPFHEKICEHYGWDTEDVLDGNEPSEKNIHPIVCKIREKMGLAVMLQQKYSTSVDTDSDESTHILENGYGSTSNHFPLNDDDNVSKSNLNGVDKVAFLAKVSNSLKDRLGLRQE